MQCVILAGGKGTRLGPLTAGIPKSMVPVAGRPFLEHQLKLLLRRGVREIVLCVGHFHAQIERYFQKGERFGVCITYSYEKDKLLGTGGALKNAAPFLEDFFLLMYGDSYLEVDYQAVWRQFTRRRLPALMTVYRNRDRYDRSNVIFEDGKVRLFDPDRKHADLQYIDYGLSVLSKNLLEEIPDGVRYNINLLYQRLAREGRLAGHEVFNRFYEIGSGEGLRELEKHLRDKRVKSEHE